MVNIGETAGRTWLWPAPVSTAIHWWLAAYLDALDARFSAGLMMAGATPGTPAFSSRRLRAIAGGGLPSRSHRPLPGISRDSLGGLVTRSSPTAAPLLRSGAEVAVEGQEPPRAAGKERAEPLKSIGKPSSQRHGCGASGRQRIVCVMSRIDQTTAATPSALVGPRWGHQVVATSRVSS